MSLKNLIKKGGEINNGMVFHCKWFRSNSNNCIRLQKEISTKGSLLFRQTPLPSPERKELRKEMALFK